jgi:hypothetical protein
MAGLRVEEQHGILVCVPKERHVLVGEEGPGEACEKELRRDPSYRLDTEVVVESHKLSRAVQEEDVDGKTRGLPVRLGLLGYKDKALLVKEVVEVRRRVTRLFSSLIGRWWKARWQYLR